MDDDQNLLTLSIPMYKMVITKQINRNITTIPGIHFKKIICLTIKGFYDEMKKMFTKFFIEHRFIYKIVDFFRRKKLNQEFGLQTNKVTVGLA